MSRVLTFVTITYLTFNYDHGKNVVGLQNRTSKSQHVEACSSRAKQTFTRHQSQLVLILDLYTDKLW